MLKVLLDSVRFKASLELDSELTLIGGDSGIGKTYLCKQIDICKDVDAISVEPSEYSNYIIDNIISIHDFRFKLQDGKHHIFFIDKLEQWDNIDREEVEQLIFSELENRLGFNYFVIMYRGYSRLAIYGLQLKYLKFVDNVMTLRSVP